MKKNRRGLTVVLVVLLIGCTSAPSATTNLDEISLPPFKSWKIVDPRDPSLPDLIIGDGGDYHLDPSWELASIVYTYEWGGLGEPVNDTQSIKAQDGGFIRDDGEPVAAGGIEALILAVGHLHPVSAYIGGHAWTDDYPSWQLLITGQDGRTVEIQSTSTGNVGSGPWNVYTNGRIYAQYDGTLGDAIMSLFESERGSPTAVFSPGGRDQNLVYFEVTGWPSTLEPTDTLIDYYLFPPPEEFQAALAKSPKAQELLNDHAIIQILYSGEVSPNTPLKGATKGEVIFAGEAMIEGKVVRYTIGAQFEVHDGSFTRFDLDRAVLSNLLGQVMKQPLTMRVLTEAPSAIVNMWYASPTEQSAPGNGPIYVSTEYAALISACGDILRTALPSNTDPLIAFGYNDGASFYDPEFVLVNGKTVVRSFDYGRFPWRAATLARLLPPLFDTQGKAREFDRIWVQGHDMFGDYSSLTLRYPGDASAEEKKVYEAIIAQLPVPTITNEYWEGVEIVANNMTFVVDDQGYLQPQACK